jgi:hypothetical protein
MAPAVPAAALENRANRTSLRSGAVKLKDVRASQAMTMDWKRSVCSFSAEMSSPCNCPTSPPRRR